MKHIILFITLLLFPVLMTGCDDDDEYVITANHDIPACGIEDPLVNIPWLAESISQWQKAYSISVHVFKSKTEDIYCISISNAGDPDYLDTGYNEILSCEGERWYLFSVWNWEGFEQFHEEYELIGQIWSIQKVSK